MINKILKALSLTFLSIFIASSTLFTEVSPTLADQMRSESNGDNSSMGFAIEESSDDLNGSNTNAVPDLGDDQAFPFIPGFGKNSGKD